MDFHTVLTFWILEKRKFEIHLLIYLQNPRHSDSNPTLMKLDIVFRAARDGILSRVRPACVPPLRTADIIKVHKVLLLRELKLSV